MDAGDGDKPFTTHRRVITLFSRTVIVGLIMDVDDDNFSPSNSRIGFFALWLLVENPITSTNQMPSNAMRQG